MKSSCDMAVCFCISCHLFLIQSINSSVGMLLNKDCTSSDMKMYPGGICVFLILLTKSYEFLIAYLLLCDFVKIFAMYFVKLYSGPPIVETIGLPFNLVVWNNCICLFQNSKCIKPHAIFWCKINFFNFLLGFLR
jgi:hypothetical protein